MSEWISVKDRLPTYFDDVWAWVVFSTGEARGTETWLEDNGSWVMGSAKNFTVTHWMPLPDPPSAVDREKKEGAYGGNRKNGIL